MSFLCTVKRLGKSIVDIRNETDSTIQRYNQVLNSLKERFLYNAVRDIYLDGHDRGKHLALRWF
jgi:hypothetical protein